MGSLAKSAEEVGGDILATVTGIPEFIPLINAGVTAGNDLAKGKSLGTSLGQGALAGGEALAGQEFAGAVGIGSGNSAFNDALGITTTPASTGLPDIGGAISSGFNSLTSGASDAINGVSNYLGGSPTGGATGTAITPDVSGAASAAAGGAPPTAVSPVTSSVLPATGFSDQANAAIGSQLAGPSTSDSTNLDLSEGPNTTTFPSTTPDLSQAGGNLAPATGTQAASLNPNTGSSWLPSKGTALGAGLALAPAALAAIQGPPKLPAAAQPLQPSGAATAPLISTENQQLASANAGTISPSQQASLDQMKQSAQNQLIQQLVSEGVTDYQHDSRYIQGMQQIQQNILAQQQQFIQQAYQNAFSAAGAAGTNLQAAANEQTANDTSYSNALNNALTAAGSIVGGVPINQKQATN